ncbi:MAG: hypothetical protein EOO38_23600 [Cytophagaceae bacterium]|nr:MAG: hypothetical protein EOO38_23600 [Cytophagaceae bacterium]
MSYTLQTQPTQMDHQSHTVTTTDHDFANALFEQALNIDIEPEFVAKKGAYTVEFIATPADCFGAILLAMAKGGVA